MAASTTTLKNVVYLRSQRSAITVRASCTWWLTAPLKLSHSSPPVLREDTKLNRSLRLLLSWEKGEERTATRLHRTLRRAGQRSRSAQAGHHRKLCQVSCPHHLKNRAERGLLFRKGKKLKAFVVTFHFLYPLGMSTSCKYRGNNFIISSWPGILTTVEELWNFFSVMDKSLQTKIHLSRVHYVWPSVCVCMSVHARVCMCTYLKVYIFSISPLSSSHKTVKQYAQYPQKFLNSFLKPVSKSVQRNKQETPRNHTQKQTKPDQSHT